MPSYDDSSRRQMERREGQVERVLNRVSRPSSSDVGTAARVEVEERRNRLRAKMRHSLRRNYRRN